MDNTLFPFFFRAKPHAPKELYDDASSLYYNAPQAEPKQVFQTRYYGRRIEESLPY